MKEKQGYYLDLIVPTAIFLLITAAHHKTNLKQQLYVHLCTSNIGTVFENLVVQLILQGVFS